MCVVDPPSGRVTVTETDFRLAGLIPLAMQRAYRSNPMWQGDLGHGWGHVFGVQLWAEENRTKLVFRGTDGRRAFLKFPTEEAVAENPEMRIRVALMPAAFLPWPQLKSELSQGVFAVDTAGLPTLLFDARGGQEAFVLRGMADRSGNLVAVSPGAGGRPARAEDPHGRTLVFARNAHGWLRELSLIPAGSTQPIFLARYDYDEQGDLVAVHDPAGTRNYAYDSAHRLVSRSNRLGGKWTMVYDKSGQCIRSSEPGGIKQRSYDYDPDHGRTTVTDSLGAKMVFESGLNGRVVRTTDKEGGISTFDYDADDRLVRVTNQLGGETTICFDGKGAPAGVVLPDGTVTGILTNARGEVTQIYSGTGASTKYVRDELGRVVEMTRPAQGTCKVSYNAQGQMEGLTTPLGKEVKLEWAKDRSRFTVSDADGKLAEQEMDPLGRVTRFRDAAGAVTRYNYDRAGNLSEIIRPDETRRRYVYDAEGRLTELTDEAGRTTRWQFDEGGRSVAVTRPDGKVVKSAYDSESRLVAVQEPSGLTHSFVLTPRGLVAEQKTTDGRVIKFKHDAVGRIVAAMDPAGGMIVSKRDALGRIVETSYPDPSLKKVQSRCDGLWLRAEQDGHVVARELSPEGFATREQQDDFWLKREYGPAGQLTDAIDSFGRKVAYGYNPDDKVAKVVITQGTWTEKGWVAAGPGRTHGFEYDRVGNQIAWTMPSGKKELRTYDQRRRLVEQKVVLGEKVIVKRTYGYEPGGRAILIDDSLRGRKEIGLDVLGRIVSVVDGARTRTFNYTAADDLAANLTYAPGHRVLTAAGVGFDYDVRGNIVRRRAADGRADEFIYQSQGLLKEAHLGGGTKVGYEYDPHLRLVRIMGGPRPRRYFWDQERVWAMQEGEAEPVFFTRLPGAYSPIEQSYGGRYYSVHVDHCEKVQEVIDDEGRVVWQNQDGVWGEGRQPAPGGLPGAESPFGFPGQIWDEATGLFYNRYRFYHPHAAHYTTPDPAGIYGGTDAYRYVVDPVNLTDPLGLECRGKTDDSTLYRGDSRPPSEICSQGFQPSNPAADISALQHADAVPTSGSNWISTAYESSTAERFAKSGVHSQRAPPNAQPWVYVIDNPGCGVEIDCEPGAKEKWGDDSEQEIAFKGGLPSSKIMGYYNADAGPSSFQACP